MQHFAFDQRAGGRSFGFQQGCCRRDFHRFAHISNLHGGIDGHYIADVKFEILTNQALETAGLKCSAVRARLKRLYAEKSTLVGYRGELKIGVGLDDRDRDIRNNGTTRIGYPARHGGCANLSSC